MPEKQPERAEYIKYNPVFIQDLQEVKFFAPIMGIGWREVSHQLQEYLDFIRGNPGHGPALDYQTLQG
ncbi:MAG: hypothetical protein JWO78_264 [Micavibrio sp.]|nr:hypothetical protein [Micavibrio sp.]